jgi:Undecaprenyl-phosphate glucose phosphotransferase
MEGAAYGSGDTGCLFTEEFSSRRRVGTFTGRRLGIALAISDFALTSIATIGLFYIIYGPSGYNVDRHTIAGVLYALVTVVILFSNRLYDPGVIIGWPAHTFRLLMLVALSALVLLLVAASLQISDEYSRKWFFLSVPSCAAVISVNRGAAVALLAALGRAGIFTRNIAIVGEGRHARLFMERLQRNAKTWTRLYGIFDPPCVASGAPWAGGSLDFGRLRRLLEAGLIDDVIVTLPWSEEQRILSTVRELRFFPVRVHLGPDLIGYHVNYLTTEKVDGSTVYLVSLPPLGAWKGVFKLLEDKVLATLLLLLFAPLMLLIAILIKCDSRGPVFFRQIRYGYNNRLIKVWKFRSMYHERCDRHGTTSVGRADPRVTRVGSILRRTSLDELPQLFNVLQGDMSMVGPRPHALKSQVRGKEFEVVVENYAARHVIKPGITGWAQVNGWRGEVTCEHEIIKRCELDLYYIENWSFGLDIRILMLTALRGWGGIKAY